MAPPLSPSADGAAEEGTDDGIACDHTLDLPSGLPDQARTAPSKASLRAWDLGESSDHDGERTWARLGGTMMDSAHTVPEQNGSII